MRRYALRLHAAPLRGGGIQTRARRREPPAVITHALPELQHRQGVHLMHLGLQPGHRHRDVGTLVHDHVARAHACVPGGEVGIEIIGDEVDLPRANGLAQHPDDGFRVPRKRCDADGVVGMRELLEDRAAQRQGG